MIRTLAGTLLLVLATQAQGDACVFRENNLDAPLPLGGGPVPITIHLYLNDLVEVRDAEQSFVADVFIRAEWLDPRLAHGAAQPCSVDEVTIWTPQLQLLNRRNIDRVLQPELTVSSNGKVRQVLRAYGDFGFHADLTAFPFDHQELAFSLVSTLGLDDVQVVTEPDNLGMAEQVSVTNWRVRGDGSRSSEYYVAPVHQTISRLDVVFRIERLTGFYTWQLLVPLFLVVMMTWTVFWMPLEFVAPRVGLVATSMLTLIAYRFSMSSILPPIAYLTRLDIFMVAASVLVFCALAAAVAVTHLENVGRGRQADGLNAASRWLAPALFLLVFVKVFLV